jgi:N6-L-threonylcarbamoyladenine synthase
LRATLDAALARRGGRVHYPEPALCTDNGAMIAFAGALRLAAGESGPEAPAVRIRPRWPMVDLRPPAQAPAAL